MTQNVFQRQLRSDIAAGAFEIFSAGEAEFALAELLLERHAFTLRLRALDALQLAVAMELRARDLADFFVEADKALCEVARHERFQVINPEEMRPGDRVAG